MWQVILHYHSQSFFLLSIIHLPIYRPMQVFSLLPNFLHMALSSIKLHLLLILHVYNGFIGPSAFPYSFPCLLLFLVTLHYFQLLNNYLYPLGCSTHTPQTILVQAPILVALWWSPSFRMVFILHYCSHFSPIEVVSRAPLYFTIESSNVFLFPY